MTQTISNFHPYKKQKGEEIYLIFHKQLVIKFFENKLNVTITIKCLH